MKHIVVTPLPIDCHFPPNIVLYCTFAFIVMNLGRTSHHMIYCLISFSLLTGRDKQPLPAASVLTCCNIGDDHTKLRWFLLLVAYVENPWPEVGGGLGSWSQKHGKFTAAFGSRPLKCL